MHPRANPKRQDRDGRGKALEAACRRFSGLVGRALRAAVHMDVLPATAQSQSTATYSRPTAAANGGRSRAASVALALALSEGRGRALREPVAATSVGLLDAGGLLLDLCYIEDSKARVDLNVVATATGKIVEVQGTAEGAPVERSDIDAMVDLALAGIVKLGHVQRDALARAGVDLAGLVK